MNVFQGNDEGDPGVSRLGDRARLTSDRLTGIPKRVTEIEAYPTVVKEGGVVVSEENAEGTFREFIREHSNVFRVEADDLRLVSIRNINNRWYVKYEQRYKGLPVHKATVGLDSSEDGKVGTYAASYHPDIDLPVEPAISLEAATGAAIETYPKGRQRYLRRQDDVLLVYPEKSDDQVSYHLAWKIQIVTEEPDPELEKFFIVDALDGTILRSYTANFPGAQVTGMAQAEVYPENPTDPISTVPLEHEYVEIEDAGTTTTNSAGRFKKYVNWLWPLFHWPTGDATFTLDGPYARVQDSAGVDFTETRPCNTTSPCNMTWSATDRDHINVFYHMNLFHDWLADQLGYSWKNPWDGTSRLNAQVNHSFNNAYAGNPMKFGTDPFARSSDVIYHECIHNVLYEIYGDYIGWPDSHAEAYGMDEGFADYFSSSFTNDSRHGEGYTSSPRNLDNNKQYPGKSGYNIEGHTGGLFIGGAGWELRQRLVNIYGGSGARIADQLLLEAHQILSTYPRDYYYSDPSESNLLSALYRAADIDNNLKNGFPYFNDMQLAFHAHGLLQAVLEDRDSFDFSTNTLGTLTGGDLYYYDGKFWANNYEQNGVKDLGGIGTPDLGGITIPKSGYTRFGVDAVEGHTYVSKAQDGEQQSYIVFRVTDLGASKSTVTVQYLYRVSPFWYIANLNTKEIHKPVCRWVSLMAAGNKHHLKSLKTAAHWIKDDGYNGCYYCLNRYDTDTHTMRAVLRNLNADLETP
ncbi:MAG: hypothetical protein GY926_08175 [bacterium]|nr:hypothetical protein [bacterium]